jgi:hypothetical protein
MPLELKALGRRFGTDEAQVRKSSQTLTLLSDPTSMGGSIGISNDLLARVFWNI